VENIIIDEIDIGGVSRRIFAVDAFVDDDINHALMLLPQ